MPPFTRPDLPDGPLNDLLVDLHELHLLAGWPSTRTMELQVGSSSHTRIHKLFVEPRRPDWGLLELVVEYLARATRRDVERTRDHFHDRWLAVARPFPHEAGAILSLPRAALPVERGPSAGEAARALTSLAAEAVLPAAARPEPVVARAKKAPPHEAERIFQFLVARGSTTALVTYGNWLFRRGNLDEAERLLSEAGEQRVSQALICLGKVLERKGRLSEAQSSYEEAARRGDSHSLVALGKLHEKLRDFPAAEEAYKAAIRVGDAAEVPLGYLLEKMGEFGRAERIYEDAINNLDWAAVIPLGKLYARREEYEQEADLYEGVIGRASRSLPNNIPARLAGIREREGRLNDALNLYRLSLSMGNEDARSSVIRLEGEVAQAEE